VDLPRLTSDQPRASAIAPTAAPAALPTPESAPAMLAPEHRFSLLPWLAVALALGAAGAFLFWRNRSRAALAGGPRIDAFLAPDPAPQPVRPQPRTPQPRAPQQNAPRPTPPPSSLGVVSTRIRPWIEIGIQPLRCLVDDEQVVVDFELELFNSGSAPA